MMRTFFKAFCLFVLLQRISCQINSNHEQQYTSYVTKASKDETSAITSQTVTSGQANDPTRRTTSQYETSNRPTTISFSPSVSQTVDASSDPLSTHSEESVSIPIIGTVTATARTSVLRDYVNASRQYKAMDETNVPSKVPIFSEGRVATSVISPRGPICDFCLYDGEGNFTSYGYPLPYRSELDCTYRVKRVADDECQIEATFHVFDLQTEESSPLGGRDLPDSDHCQHDYLSVAGRRFCGREHQGQTEVVPFDRSLTELTFYFHSDRQVSGKGFWIEVKRRLGSCPPANEKSPSAESCGPNDFPEKDSIITSPNFPEDYNDDVDCQYVFRQITPDVCGLEITFLRFDVEQSDGCVYDYLEINGERICGSLPPNAIKVFMFSEFEKLVRFVTDRQTTRSGFSLRTRQITDCHPQNELPPPPACAVCTDRPEGDISSYGYPDDYRNNLLCTYTVDRFSPQMCRLQLDFLDFDVHYTPGCEADYLMVEGRRICGSRQAGQRQLINFGDKGSLVFVFKTDGSSVRKGFNLHYRQLPCFEPLEPTESSSTRSSCDVEYREKSFTLESPEHPETYPNDIDCKYRITKFTPGVCQLKVTFVTFDVEGMADDDDNPCQNDYLIVEGENDKLCGTLPAEFSNTYNFDSEEKILRFHSDTSTGRPGFLAKVEQIDCEKESKEPEDTGDMIECDQVIEDLQADIVSPGYPTQYQNNLNCRYTVKKDSAIDICRLQITFKDFAIQTGDVCQYDFLQVDNFKLCGSTPEGTQRSYDFKGNELKMLFHTNENETYKGFRITVRQIPCQTTTNGPRPTTPTIATTTALPSGVRVPESCDAVFTEREFMIQSNSYPDSYPDGKDCRYLVLKNTPNVCALELTFRDFKLEEDENCVADYLEVDNNRFCGILPSRTKRTFSFDGPTKTIYFHSDHRHYDFGFKIIARQIDCEEEASTIRPTTYTTRRPTTTARPRPTYPSTPTYYTKPPPKVCRQYIRAKEAEIKSPSYPKKYPNNLNCSFIVVKSSPSICELKVQILKFDVESSSGCEYDYLLVEGERLCGTLPTNMTRIYDFRNRQKVIRFNSDAASSRMGFLLKLKQLPCRGTSPGTTDYPSTSLNNNCDRVYTGRRFAIRSEGYPRNYEGNLDCRYTVRKYSANVCALEVEFAAFAIESSDRCTEDYLEIDNKRFCGTLPRTAKRTFDFLPFEKVIRFHSNSRQSGPGFLLRIRQIDCSTTPVVPQPSIADIPSSPCTFSFKDVNGRFNSVNYPNSYPANTMCKYKIEALPGYCNVELSFPTFQLKPSGGSNLVCYEDYIEINGVRYCGEQLQGHTKTVVFEDKWNAVVIQMISDNYDEGRGFDATYRQIACNSYKPTKPYDVSTRPPIQDQPDVYCDRFLGSPTFDLNNPELPQSGRQDDDLENIVDCRYTVPRLSNRYCKIRLRYEIFDVMSQNGCEFDFLEIQGKRICGRLPHSTIREYEFTDSQVLIRFHSENSQSSRFKIHGEQVDCTVYTTVTPELPVFRPTITTPTANCDRKISANEFEISSVNYPNGYPHSLFCRFIIEKQDKNVCGLELNFVRFEVQDSRNCLRDYFSIEDRKICGTLPPHTTRTYDFFDHEKLLYFRSDGDINGPGFFIEGRQVLCRNSPYIQPTGNTPPIPLPSTPVFPEKRPEGNCDRFFTEEEFVIETPFIQDRPFPFDMNCRFAVRRLNNNVCALDLTFIKFDLDDEMPECRRDYLEISSDGFGPGQFNRRHGRPPFRICGRMGDFAFRRIEFLLPEVEKIFTFHTDRALAGKGFAIRVHQSSNCGPQDNLWMPLVPQRFPPRNLQFKDSGDSSHLPCEVCRRQVEGSIESPRYPSKYPNNIHCEYHIERLSGYCALEVSFVDFQIEIVEQKSNHDTLPPCGGDFLEIEGRRYCGFMLNGVTRVYPFPTKEPSQVKLVLASDQFVGGRGFRAEYKQLPCRDTRALNSTLSNAPLLDGKTLNTQPVHNISAMVTGAKSTIFPEIQPRHK